MENQEPPITQQEEKALTGEARTIIVGDNNTITVIERQYNDKSAVDTVKDFLDSNKRSEDFQRSIINMGISMIPDLIGKFTPRQAQDFKPNQRKAQKKKVPAKTKTKQK